MPQHICKMFSTVCFPVVVCRHGCVCIKKGPAPTTRQFHTVPSTTLRQLLRPSTTRTSAFPHTFLDLCTTISHNLTRWSHSLSLHQTTAHPYRRPLLSSTAAITILLGCSSTLRTPHTQNTWSCTQKIDTCPILESLSIPVDLSWANHGYASWDCRRYRVFATCWTASGAPSLQFFYNVPSNQHQHTNSSYPLYLCNK